MKNLLTTDISFYILLSVIIILIIAEIYFLFRDRKGYLRVLTKNRDYKIGDVVEGVVAFRAKRSFSSAELTLEISYYLKPTQMSYGRKLNEVVLQRNSVLLFDEQTIKSGKRESFPFRFEIPTEFILEESKAKSSEEKIVSEKNTSGVIEIPKIKEDKEEQTVPNINTAEITESSNQENEKSEPEKNPEAAARLLTTIASELPDDGRYKLFITLDAHVTADGIDLHAWKALQINIE